MSNTAISIIICTLNPRPDYLCRVLVSLKAQTLSKEQWELLLIDNASKEPLAGQWDLSWHPHARHIREDELGLTPARLRGIKESKGDLLVFVDDDNILAADYLEQSLKIADEFPKLGALGGSIKGEFEIPPPEWIKPYLAAIVVFELDRDYWSNMTDCSCGSWVIPYGAGFIIRRQVAEDYVRKTNANSLRKALGRNGISLGAGEDTDMALCSVDLGFGFGRFKALKVTHIIPRVRLTPEYIVRLHAGFAFAAEVLKSIRPSSRQYKSPRWKEHIRLLINCVRASKMQRRILLASDKAKMEARKHIASSLLSKQGP